MMQKIVIIIKKPRRNMPEFFQYSIMRKALIFKKISSSENRARRTQSPENPEPRVIKRETELREIRYSISPGADRTRSDSRIAYASDNCNVIHHATRKLHHFRRLNYSGIQNYCKDIYTLIFANFCDTDFSLIPKRYRSCPVNHKD